MRCKDCDKKIENLQENGTFFEPPKEFFVCGNCLEVAYLNAFDTKVRSLTLLVALEESIKLQAHYGELLNMNDGGKRRIFKTPEAWIARLIETGTIVIK